MPSSGSTGSCVADSASVAMPRKLDSLRYRIVTSLIAL
ncbi:hypothetical protein Golob_002915, partial [Gossypium lobatum]|nr:hypothetical protein [Gossypium lobatum]